VRFHAIYVFRLVWGQEPTLHKRQFDERQKALYPPRTVSWIALPSARRWTDWQSSLDAAIADLDNVITSTDVQIAYVAFSL
jgi:hypothetical protein